MEGLVRIALDAMGGDNAPAVIVEGACSAVSAQDGIRILLVGKRDAIEKELAQHTYSKDRIEIVEAEEVIGTAEHPVEAVRRKKNSSICVGLNLVRKGEADAFCSAGNSGAVLVGGQLLVGRVRGVDRPPFAALIPTGKGVTLLLDSGANVDARPNHLVQWARLGTIYMEHVVGVKNPTVGLVNIGAEEEKGNALVRETFPLLKECAERGEINFIGSAEARDIPAGVCDVAVCDGFTGNVVLKMYEGTAKVLLSSVRSSIMSGTLSKLGGLLIKPALKKGTMASFDATRYGGAPMLGLKGLVVKMHGSAKAVEVQRAMEQCEQFCRQGITEKVMEYAREEQAAKDAEKAAAAGLTAETGSAAEAGSTAAAGRATDTK